MMDIYELRGDVEAYIRRYNVSKYDLAMKLGFKYQQSLSRKLNMVTQDFADEIKKAVDEIVKEREK